MTTAPPSASLEPRPRRLPYPWHHPRPGAAARADGARVAYAGRTTLGLCAWLIVPPPLRGLKCRQILDGWDSADPSVACDYVTERWPHDARDAR